jgi:hypothetical protein
MPFEPIETQEQLDAIIAKRLKDQKDLTREVEDLRAKIEHKDREIASLQKTHALERELDKRGLDQPVMQGKLETIKRLVDLDSDEDPAQQLDSLSKSVPELFEIPRGAGSGRLAPRSTLTPVLDREKPLTEEDISKMTPEQIAKTPGLMERIDKFMSGQR